MKKNYFDIQDELDNIITIDPTRDAIDQFIKLTKDITLLQYAFDHLDLESWLKPLYENNFFSNPPIIKKSEERIIFPVWPQSRYLARMATKDPQTVLEIMFKITETNNFRIHADFVDAACNMPVEFAVQWAANEAEWIERQENLHWWLPEKIGQLISYLANGKQIDTALKLAKSTLAVLPVPEDKKIVFKEESGDSEYTFPPDPKFRIENRDYQDIINNHIMPDLLPVAGMKSLELVCDLLKDFFDIKERKSQNDLSYISRKAIEDHEQNHYLHNEDFLISAVRDIGNLLISKHKAQIFNYLEDVKRYYKIFKRISIYLRRIHDSIDIEGTKAILLDPKVIDDPHYWHEYYHLICDVYPKLLSEEKDKYLIIIQEAEPEKKFIQRIKEEKDEDLTELEEENRIRRWQYRKLYPIQEYLEGDWKDIFATMENEFGVLDHPDFESYMGTTWVGPTSPKTLDDLKAMSIDELVKYCKDEFKPSSAPQTPSPEGLSRNLNVLVQDNPGPYAKEAIKFQDLMPPYVRGIVDGFRDSIKAHHAFDWKPILELCFWVVEQKDDIPGYDPEYKEEKGWSWTRRRIADLLETGLMSSSAEIPIQFRERVWLIVEKLTHDTDPDEAHEKQYSGDNLQPATMSINTVRGNAMHAVMQYALWIMRDVEKSDNDDKNKVMDFTIIPEVRNVLEEHLDIQKEPTLTIRSVYGRWFPWLVLLDKEWAKKNVKVIFPFEDKRKEVYFSTSWGTYITFNKPYDQVFEVMKDVYGYVVDHPDFKPKTEQGLTEPEKCLPEHLIVLFWRNIVDMEEPDNLILRFFQNASPELRGHAVMFIGRCLENRQTEEIERLRKLLKYRLEFVKSGIGKSEIQEEFRWFGLLLEADKLDNQWVLESLKQLLHLGLNLENKYKLAKKFDTLIETFPEIILDCMELMIQNEPEGYIRIYDWKDSAYKILQKALAIDSVKDKAIDLVHRMGSIGFLDFRELLRNK